MRNAQSDKRPDSCNVILTPTTAGNKPLITRASEQLSLVSLLFVFFCVVVN